MGVFSCEFCKFTDCSKSKVSSHMLTRHHCNISYSCTLCDFHCGLKEIFCLHLLSHQHCRELNSDTDNTEEDICNDVKKRELPKLFEDDVKILNHPLHKGEEKPLIRATKRRKCRHKGTFSSKNKDLKASSCNHLKILSPGRKPKQLSALSNHVQYKHKKIQDYMYECVECNKKFTSLSSLEPHLRTHLTDEISKSKNMVITSRATRMNLRKASPLVANKAGSNNEAQTVKERLLTEMKETLISPLKITENDCSENQERMTEVARVKVRDRRGHANKTKAGTEADQHSYKGDTEEIQKSLGKGEHQEKEKEEKELHYTQSEIMFLEVAKRIDRKATEFHCPHCPYIGKVFRNFKEHVMGHSKHRPYVCSICCSSFVCKSKLVRHQRQVHNEARPFLCSECPYTGKSRSSLETHRLVMHPREEHLRFSCCHCPARFARASMLKTHNLQHDTGSHKLFSCPSCSFSTNYRRQFELHSTLHTGKSCLCSLCGKAYSGQAQLRIHMKVQHSDQSFHCTLCDFVTKRPEGLTKHMKSHSTDRPYSCPHCDYKGKRKAHLHRHILRHLKIDQAPEKSEKSEVAGDGFLCCSCNKVFKTTDRLMHHLKTHHVHDNDISQSMQCNLNNPISSSNSSNHITNNSFASLDHTNFSHQKEANTVPSNTNSFSCNSNITNGTSSSNWVSQPVQYFTPSPLAATAVTNTHHHDHLRQTQTVRSVTSQYLDSETLSVATSSTNTVHLETQPLLPGHSHIAPPYTSHTSTNAPHVFSQYKHIVSSSVTPFSSQPLGMVSSATKLQQSNQYPVITASVAKPPLGSQNLDMIAPAMTSLSSHSHGLMAPLVISPASNEHQGLAPHTKTLELRGHQYCAVTSVATPCLNSQQPGMITPRASFHSGSYAATENTSSTLYQHPDLTTSMNFQEHKATSEVRNELPSSSHYPGLTATTPLGLAIPSSAVSAHQLQPNQVMPVLCDVQRNKQGEY